MRGAPRRGGGCELAIAVDPGTQSHGCPRLPDSVCPAETDTIVARKVVSPTFFHILICLLSIPLRSYSNLIKLLPFYSIPLYFHLCAF